MYAKSLRLRFGWVACAAASVILTASALAVLSQGQAVTPSSNSAPHPPYQLMVLAVRDGGAKIGEVRVTSDFTTIISFDGEEHIRFLDESGKQVRDLDAQAVAGKKISLNYYYYWTSDGKKENVVLTHHVARASYKNRSLAITDADQELQSTNTIKDPASKLAFSRVEQSKDKAGQMVSAVVLKSASGKEFRLSVMASAGLAFRSGLALTLEDSGDLRRFLSKQGQ